MPLSFAFSPSAAPALSKEQRCQWVRAFGFDSVRLSFAEKKNGAVVRTGWIENGNFIPSFSRIANPDWIHEIGVASTRENFWEQLLPYPFCLLSREGLLKTRTEEWKEVQALFSAVEARLIQSEIACFSARVGDWRPAPIFAQCLRGQCQRVAVFPELLELQNIHAQGKLDSEKLREFFGTQAVYFHWELDPAEAPLLHLQSALKSEVFQIEFKLTDQDSTPFTL